MSGRPFILLSVVAVVGCVVGPDPQRPAVAVTPADAYVADPVETDAEPERIAGWWRRFGDPLTEELVERALVGNTDAEAAAATVLEARAILAARTSSRLPAATFGADVSRQSLSLALPTGRENFINSAYDLSLNVGWQADLFGKLRRAQQAAAARLVAAEADRVATLHSVVSETIRARVALATARLQLELAEANVTSLRDTRRTVEAFYEAGGGVGDVSALDVRLARQNVAAAVAQVPPLRRNLVTSELTLAVLLGVRPGTLPPVPGTLDALPAFGPPPPGLPVELLDRRPDLVASEFRALAAQAEIGVEVADLFPDLTLTGSAGYTSAELNDVLDPTSQTWNLAASLLQPLFDGAGQVGEIEAARAAAQREAADYRGLVLRALQEVEAALAAERLTRQELAALTESLAEAEAAETLARDRYERGLAGLLEVFEAERRRRNAEVSLVAARQGVWEARIDLHLALGGDWELPARPVGRDTTLTGPMREPGWPTLKPGLTLPLPGADGLDLNDSVHDSEADDE